MLKALITLQNIATGKYHNDQRGYIDETKTPVVHCNFQQQPINQDKFRFMSAFVTDDNWQLHSTTVK